MKIMTFNTQHCKNYLTGEIDYNVMADVIKSCAPDFVALNEMRDAGEAEEFAAQTKILAELCGMDYFFFAKAIDARDVSSPYGNAIISKHKLVETEVIPLPAPEIRTGKRWYEDRCILKARLDCGLTVMVIHVGLNPDEQVPAMRVILENAEKENCVLLGDFNMQPDNEILSPLTSVFDDTAKAVDKQLLTIPSDTPTRKIDYIFVTKDIKTITTDVVEKVASDHLALVAEIVFPS